MEILRRFLGVLFITLAVQALFGGIVATLFGVPAILKLYIGTQLAPIDKEMLWLGAIGVGASASSFVLGHIGLWLTDDNVL